MVLGYSPKMPKRTFWHSESPQTHNTRTGTHCRHHIAQCYSLGVRWRRLGSRLLLGETRLGPRHRQNGGQRHERHLLGTQLVVTSMAPGLLGSRALTRRSSPNETCEIKRREKVNMCLNAQHICSSYLFALLMRVSRGLRICQVACGHKRMSLYEGKFVGHYEGHKTHLQHLQAARN
jgi:hypothetical protein